MATLLATNASLVATMDEAGREICDGGLFVRDGVIEAVGPSAALPSQADEIIDLAGHVVIPGLVNTHHHLYQNLTRAVPAAQDAALFGWLRTLYPIWAVPTQDLLWQSHLAGRGEVEGVSAMPSMHVATTILFILLGFASGKRWLGWALVAFSASIFLGSIALAWHYAVDGYLGAAIALACWWMAGKC